MIRAVNLIVCGNLYTLTIVLDSMNAQIDTMNKKITTTLKKGRCINGPKRSLEKNCVLPTRILNLITEFMHNYENWD